MTESANAQAQRRAHELELERVGVETDEGQALLARWARETQDARRRAQLADRTARLDAGTYRPGE